jgi:hypothetical protein
MKLRGGSMAKTMWRIPRKCGARKGRESKLGSTTISIEKECPLE